MREGKPKVSNSKLGKSALLCAVKRGHAAVVERLLKVEYEYNIIPNDAFLWAVRNSKYDFVLQLLQCPQVDINYTELGCTPLVAAIGCESTEVSAPIYPSL